MKKHLIFVLFSSILISNVGVLNFLGFGYRNSNFLIEEVDSYELKDSKSTNYSINLSSYYFKNDIYKNINQNADISRLNSTNIDQARIDIDLYSNKKIMFGVKPLFTSNFSVESKQDNEYNLPDQQTLFYKESYSMDGDVSDYFIGYSYMHRKYKYGFILYYEFGMQTILRKIFTFPSDEKISLASKKMFERKYRSSRVNLFMSIILILIIEDYFYCQSISL